MNTKTKYHPRLNVKMIRRVKQLREKTVVKNGRKMPMPFRDIADKLGIDVKQAHLWYKYDID